MAAAGVAELVEPLLVGEEQDDVGSGRHRSPPSATRRRARAPSSWSSGRRGRRLRRSAAVPVSGPVMVMPPSPSSTQNVILPGLDRLEDVVLLTAQAEGGDRPGLRLALADLVLLGLDLDLRRAHVLERLASPTWGCRSS